MAPVTTLGHVLVILVYVNKIIVIFCTLSVCRFYEYEEDESISKDLYAKLKKIRIWDDD